ncbi:MAG: hypothetical protein ACLFWG_00985 [Longimicrobiales bacterium]
MSLVCLLALASPASAQLDEPTLGVGTHFHGYSFDAGLGAEAASLLMVPVAFHAPLSGSLEVDVYGAWARGQVERGGQVLSMEGFTDTQVRASFGPAQWALLTVSLNLPTGEATHDAKEAVVASVLATDLLGFREANWGTGFGVTPGFATARQMGPWGVGLGASYRVAGGFEPTPTSSLTYEPGNESRIRLGVDRNVGDGGKITAGFTYQRFETDRVGGQNLFEAGKRYRGDLSWAFRTGASTWTLFATDTWRDEGRFPGATGPTAQTTSQNIAQIGVAASIPVGDVHRIRPRVDFQLQSRDGPGSGWLTGVGGDFPFRLFSVVDVFPNARFLVGSVEGPSARDVSMIGAELGGTIRWQP